MNRCNVNLTEEEEDEVFQFRFLGEGNDHCIVSIVDTVSENSVIIILFVLYYIVYIFRNTSHICKQALFLLLSTYFQWSLCEVNCCYSFKQIKFIFQCCIKKFMFN